MTSRCTSDGKKISLLGYGSMRLPTTDGGHANTHVAGASDKAIDQDLLNRQVKMMLDGGVNYFDTSPVYCRGESECALGRALEASGYARGSYVIATKLSNFNPLQQSLDACRKMFANSLKALRTDYIDNYLLHAVGNGGFKSFKKRYLDNGALDWCCELREQKRIRNLGFSFHGDPKAWEWCMEHHGKYHWDFVQIQMNYIDWRHAKEVNKRNLNAEYLYGCLAERKIPAVVMEPLLGGRLAHYNWSLANELKPLDPEASLAKWAFRFCGSFKGVMTVLSGMTYTDQIRDNIATFSPLKPCSREELEALDRAAKAYLACDVVPCTACQYCMPCPYGLDIPALIAFRNEYLTKATGLSHRQLLKAYAKAIPEELRRADHCTGCGRCQGHCPQMIDIPKEIAAIDAVMDVIKAEAAK